MPHTQYHAKYSDYSWLEPYFLDKRSLLQRDIIKAQGKQDKANDFNVNEFITMDSKWEADLDDRWKKIWMSLLILANKDSLHISTGIPYPHR